MAKILSDKMFFNQKEYFIAPSVMTAFKYMIYKKEVSRWKESSWFGLVTKQKEYEGKVFCHFQADNPDRVQLAEFDTIEEAKEFIDEQMALYSKIEAHISQPDIRHP